MTWKYEVIADASGKWAGNALRFATQREAEIAAADLMARWTLVTDTRVCGCDDPVNCALSPLLDSGKYQLEMKGD